VADAKSNWLENKILDHVLRNTVYTPAATVYAALYINNGVGSTDEDKGQEVKGGGYARTAITFGAASGGQVSNSADVTFPTATADWGTIGYIGIKDASNIDVVVENCEDAWNESIDPDVTSELDTVDYKVDAGAVKLTVAAGASAGDILATEAISSLNITNAHSIALWIKCSVNTAAGDLKLLLDDTANCASPLETLNIPALVADTWTRVILPLSSPGSLTALISVGLKYAVDIGACVIRLDDITAVKGNLLYYGALTTAKTIYNGDVAKFTTGNLQVQEL